MFSSGPGGTPSVSTVLFLLLGVTPLSLETHRLPFTFGTMTLPRHHDIFILVRSTKVFFSDTYLVKDLFSLDYKCGYLPMKVTLRVSLSDYRPRVQTDHPSSFHTSTHKETSWYRMLVVTATSPG